MDLETFVAETLTQIVKGVRTAQAPAEIHGAKINPHREEIKVGGS